MKKRILPTLIALLTLLLTACSQHHYKPLIQAVIEGQTAKVAILLKQGANPNTQLKNGTTALILAASVGHIPTLSTLVKYGAKVNAKNHAGITALIAAAGSDNGETVGWLLKHRANPKLRDNHGKDAYQTAVFWGSYSSERRLKKFESTA